MIQVGDTVKMVRVHHNMNRTLKSYQHKKGTVKSIINDNECLVEFFVHHKDDISVIPQWWIKTKYIEKIETE